MADLSVAWVVMEADRPAALTCRIWPGQLPCLARFSVVTAETFGPLGAAFVFEVFLGLGGEFGGDGLHEGV